MSPVDVALTPFLGFDIELAAPCNARCSFCPQGWHGVRRRRPYPSEALLSRIAGQVDEVLALQQAQHDAPRSVIGMCGMGEPLLRPDLVLHFLGECRGVERSQVVLVTNGTYLNGDFVGHERFKLIDTVVVSVTGFRESHEAIYGTDFERVVKNVLEAHAHHPGRIRVGFVDTPEVPPEHRAEASAFWRERGVPFGVSPLHSRGGHLSHPAAYPGVTRAFPSCGVFRKLNFVSSDGEVLSCCHDVVSDHVMGDLNHESLLSIIARKQALQGTSKGFPICERCTDFSVADA